MEKVDKKYMQQAIKLANYGLGHVSPNPLVGCVIVKDGTIIGRGWHAQYGGDHAEVVAIQKAESGGHDVSGSSVYVTLEPCAHHGQTPPCAELLVKKNVAHVVFALSDPNPQACGGKEILEAASILVTSGTMADQCREQNRIWLHNIKQQKPYLIGKIATCKNGQINAALHTQTQITGPTAQAYTHRLRQACDAIIIGADTALIDDPELTVRTASDDWHPRDPLRIIIDPRGRTLNKNLKIFQNDNYYVLAQAKNAKRKTWQFDDFSPLAITEQCWQQGVRSILIEGGATTLQHFLEAGLIDEFHHLTATDKTFTDGQYMPQLPKDFKIAEERMLDQNDQLTVYQKHEI